MMLPWIVTVDGSCLSNGRNGAIAGYGVFWRPGDYRNESGPVAGDQKSGRAELTAVKRAIEIAIDTHWNKVTIRTDSEYVIKSLTIYIKKWRMNGWMTSKGYRVANYDLIRAIDDLMDEIKVRFWHVRGHKGDFGNETADAMAKNACRGHFV